MNRLIKLERVSRRDIGGPAEWGWSATAIGPGGPVYASYPTQNGALLRVGISTDTIPPLPECVVEIFHNEHSIAPGWLCGWSAPAGIQWEQADTPETAIELALRQHAACVGACDSLPACVRMGCRRRQKAEAQP